MPTITITVVDHTHLRNAGPVIQSEMRALMHRATLTVEGNVKPITPVRTGTLRRSIHNEVKSWHEGRVGTSLVYASFIETGVRRGKRGPVRRRRGPARMFAQGAEKSLPQIQSLANDTAGRIAEALT